MSHENSRTAGVLASCLAAVLLGVAPAHADRPEVRPFILANGGMQQAFSTEGLTNQTCVADRMLPPTHPYLENTIASMWAAFETGADIVEFDIRPTADRRFAVTHEWDLECRTDGKGKTSDHTLAQLQTLDVGYRYTADGGKTYPFRGKGIGLMPSLEQVLDTFPDKHLLIDMKSNEPADGQQLATALSTLSEGRRKLLGVEGGDKSIAALRQQLPDMRVTSRAIIADCVATFAATGWHGDVPQSCKNIELLLPDKIAPMLWGWPNDFIELMADNDTIVVIEKGDGTEEFSSGFDSPEDLQRLPPGYRGGVWTNHVDRIAPVFNRN
ncbi:MULTISPECIES: glycerophosphodiester phosphodiesterase family protein [unclassified Nocardia]|uniref:glycerophosphodiester phosphodiesterase family protein n=1 Tax=unclassified Nocardia TaxID=2637762 RepID=UPI001CE49B9F|nr:MULTISPECIES: glycerophosphodiester phosphodiesterase family protein [unclassified Nocardia]